MWIILGLIAIFSGILAGMGVGGGSIFILLSTIFGVFEQREAMAYNLVMFIAVGISATIFNLKNKNIDKKMLLKLIIPVCIGSIIGIIIVKKIDEKILKNFFYGFMLFIGFYEIITSVKNIIKAKNNNA